MPKRLTAEEAAALGYKPRKKLSADEAKAAGYEPAAAPAEPSIFERALSFMGPAAVGAYAHGKDALEKDLGPSSAIGAGMRGFGHGASFGFTDEARGVLGAGDELLARVSPLRDDDTRASQPLLDALRGRYHEDRNAARGEEDTAAKDHPIVHGAAEVAGAVAAPNPFGKVAAAGRTGRLISAAGQGTAAGAGMSRSEDLGGLMGDAAEGGATGLLFQGGSEALGAPLRAVAGRMRAAKARAVAERTAKDVGDVEQEVSSALGKARGKTQEASRDLEVLQRENPTVGIPLQSNVNNFLDSPEARELAEGVVSSKLESAPERLAAMQKLKAEHSVLSANAPTEAARRTEDYFKKGAMTEVSPRLKTYMTRAAGPLVGAAAGGTVGSLLDMGPGATAALTGVLGAGAGAAMGAPGTALANMLKSPRFRYGAASAIEGAAEAIPRALDRGALPATMEASQDGSSDPFTSLTEEERAALRDWLSRRVSE